MQPGYPTDYKTHYKNLPFSSSYRNYFAPNQTSLYIIHMLYIGMHVVCVYVYVYAYVCGVCMCMCVYMYYVYVCPRVMLCCVMSILYISLRLSREPGARVCSIHD